MGASLLGLSMLHKGTQPPKLMVVRRKGELICYRPNKNSKAPLRSSIYEFSSGSCRRLKRYLLNCESVYTNMITLTYPNTYPTDGRQVKKQLKAFIRWLRPIGERAKDEKWSCFWALEFQQRGAPHFHLLINFFVPYQEVGKKWSEITNGNELACSRTESIYHVERVWAYMGKYLAKSDQKKAPKHYQNVGRFWGVAGNRFVPIVEATTTEKPEKIVSTINQTLKSGRFSEIYMDFCRDLPEVVFYSRAKTNKGYLELDWLWRSLLDVVPCVDLTGQPLGSSDSLTFVG